MPFTGRQLWAAAVFILFATSAIVGLLTGIPQLISSHADRIPAWIMRPDTLWVGSIAIVTVISVLMILAPWGRKQQAARTGDPRTIEHWLIGTLESCTDVIRKMIKTGDKAQVNTAILNAVDHEIPTFLQSAISKSARASYEAAITSARSGGVNDPIDVFLVATRYIFGLLAKEYVNRGHGPKGSSV